MKLSTGVMNFAARLALFLGLFIVFSGILGSWIVPTRLLYGFNFYIYGNLGKMVLYSSILFALLTRDKWPEAEKISIKTLDWKYLLAASVTAAGFFPAAQRLLAEPRFDSNLGLALTVHAMLVAIGPLLLVFCLGSKKLLELARTYKRELLVCAVISVVLDLLIFQVWKLWPYFSGAVLVAVKWMFSLTFDNVTTPAYLTLFVGNFGVKILEACSGVDSIFLFSMLYLFIGVLDWKKFNKARLALAFIPAVAGLFAVNILRVYIIILAGVLISPEVTAKLFHTYAGMILFVIYFAIFWKLTYKWLLINPK